VAKTDKFEFAGYKILSNILRSIHKTINKSINRFLRLADKLQFEQYKMKFGQRDSDIYIVSYPKSGTTMMQMILYQLTRAGNMDFKHIYEVSPWIRNASFKDQSPLELPSPRLIKSHDYYKDFSPKTKGKVIYMCRNGMDVAVSMYHQQRNYNKTDLKFETYIKNFFKLKSWFKHTKGWLKNKKKLNVLYIRYEDLLSNIEHEIQRVNEFCNINPDQATIKRAIQRSSFDYMKKHQSKFGDQAPEQTKVYDQFIRKGKAGEGKKTFNREQTNQFDKLYQKMIRAYETRAFDKNL
jgi:hypothetical protein